MAKYGLLLCKDGSNDEVTFEALPRNYFESVGLPEKRIEEEMKKRIAMHLWIAEHGWVGLFKHVLKHGVLRVDAGQDPLEGTASTGFGSPPTSMPRSASNRVAICAGVVAMHSQDPVVGGGGMGKGSGGSYMGDGGCGTFLGRPLGLLGPVYASFFFGGISLSLSPSTA